MILLRNGDVIDGSGQPAEQASVLVGGAHIEAAPEPGGNPQGLSQRVASRDR